MQEADYTGAAIVWASASTRRRMPRTHPGCRGLRASLLLAVGASCLAAQPAPNVDVHGDYTVRRWTVRDGLPSNTVNDVLVAGDGYLWVATIEGLIRFDGRRFTVFNATNSPGLPSNRIQQIAEGPPGHLWIRAMPNGLTHYHAGVFTPSQVDGDSSEVLGIVYVEDETVWVRTRAGLARYVDGRMQAYRPDGLEPGATSVVRDADDNLWIGLSDGGVRRVSPDGSTRRFDAEPGVAAGPVNGLLVDPSGAVWAALQRGLIRITGDRVERIPHPRGQWPDQTQVQSVDAAGGVWISAEPEGWWRFDPSGGVSHVDAAPTTTRLGQLVAGPDRESWRAELRERPGASGMVGLLFRGSEQILRVTSRVSRVAFDSSGVAWVGTSGDGLLRLQARPLRVLGVADGLPSPNVYPILEDRSGAIWVGTLGDGVARLGPRPFRPAVGRSGGLTLSLYEDRDGTIWVGRFGPTCRVIGDRCVDVDPSPAVEQGRGVRAMHEDRQGRFWLGGQNGLLLGRGAPGQRTWSAIVSADGSPPHVVQAILELRDGEVLFGTLGGGVRRYVGERQFETLDTAQGLPSNNVRDLYEDADGYIWIALEDRGLCRLDRHGSRNITGGALACLDTRAGLYHDGLHRILEDAQGRFWFNTNNGIFWVERSAVNAYLEGAAPVVTSVAYTEADGMLNREGNGGMQPAGIKTRTGELWFPTRDGVVIIDPASIASPRSPRVVVEQVRIADTTRTPNDTVALGAERDVSFQYTALESGHPEAVRFQYRLTGYDDDWVYAGDQRTTTYTNLAPGAYVFEVRAQLGSAWGTPAQLIVTRVGHVWEQMWFHALLGLLLVAAAYTAYRVRLQRMAAHNAQLERVVAERTTELRKKTEELEEANSLKSRFLANISHEFRTPLTLTFGPIDDLLNGRFHAEDAARPHLERARSNGRRLLRLINQLLDLSKLDASMLVLHPEPRDLGEHLRQLAALFAEIADERRIQFFIHVPDDGREQVYDHDVLERVAINLLSNAFKFTKPGDKVSLTLFYDSDGAARIEVADTGPGIEPTHLPRLFDRFYQVEGTSSRMHEGTGIGLALAKELVELHGGDIAVASTVGIGTSFTVRLPARSAHPSNQPIDEAVAPSALPPRTSVGTLRALVAPDELTSLAAQPLTTPNLPLVLIVEDNADMRAYVRSHLEDGFSLIEASNGRDGLELAREEIPDLVLSDVMMPGMNGVELCAALKADERTSHIPVVLLTARAQVEARIEGYESGADAYIAKPFNADELRVRVRTLIADRRRLRERFAALPPDRSVAEETNSVDAEPAPAVSAREAAFLEKLTRTIEARLADASYGVDRLAEEMFMSPRQLYRKVDALTGETPAAFIRRLRMRRAKELLSTGLSVKEVAYQVGFRSRPSFSAAYRQAYGVSPSDHGDARVES